MEKKDNILEVNIKFNKEEFDKAIDKAFDKKKDSIKLDGFRAGKVPKDVYFKKEGKENLYMDAVDILLPNAYDKALKKIKKDPIAEPKVNLKSLTADGVEFTFTIITKPKVEVKKYKDLGVAKPKVSVTKKEIEEEIAKLLEKYNELVIKEKGSVESGNIAVIDFEGFKDGEAFEGGKAENHALEIGSNSFIPGFEDQIIGMKKGGEKDINVTFPEDYQAEDLKGKEVIFKVKVNEIKEKKTRELDEDFFEDLGLEGVNSKETLEKEVKSNLKVNKEQEADNKYVDDLLKELAKHTKVDVPEEVIESEINFMVQRFEEQIKMQGITLDLFYQMTKSNEQALREQMKEEAIAHVTYRFIIDEIKEIEKISIDEKEVEKEIEKLSKQYNVDKEQFVQSYGGKENLKYEMEIKKVIDFLKENN